MTARTSSEVRLSSVCRSSVVLSASVELHQVGQIGRLDADVDGVERCGRIGGVGGAIIAFELVLFAAMEGSDQTWVSKGMITAGTQGSVVRDQD